MFLKYFTPDRRRRKRQMLKASVRVFTASGLVDALGINVSDVGMGLFAVANLKVGSHIEVELLLPGNSEPVRVAGTVRYRALYLYGIEFLPEPDQIAVRSDSDHAQSESHAENIS